MRTFSPQMANKTQENAERFARQLSGINSTMYTYDTRYDKKQYHDPVLTSCKHVYDPMDREMSSYATAAQHYCSSTATSMEALKHVLLVWVNRFWKPSARFAANGEGVVILQPTNIVEQTTNLTFALQELQNDLRAPPAAASDLASKAWTDMGDPAAATFNAIPKDNNIAYMKFGMHFMHGPNLPTVGKDNNSSSSHCEDLLILRPNIEHEMLGVIMGRGGTQELGSTFWGQTELSCYDDAQHGIWGMSYKYHERAIVTNERNLIRVYDVAFDGYNGGLDQTAVNWSDPDSCKRFREATYARDRPYNGPSMLVMSLPCNPAARHKPFPNPIVFHTNVNGRVVPDSEGQFPRNDHMVFSQKNASHLNEAKVEAYMRALGMTQWASLDLSNRPAGENCVSNETSSNMLAFQGDMKIYDHHMEIGHIRGSGHLGPSYIGVASVREGRGLMTAVGQPTPYRMI